MNWIGFDIGGTRIKGGILDDAGRILARSVEDTQARQSLRALERQLDKLVSRLLQEAPGDIGGIGAAITGPVNPAVGCVYLPGKIRGLDRHRTVPFLRQRWKVPVTADNDGRLACLAEWRAGAGRGCANLVVFTLGTGIGSGVVLDGRLLTDRHFQRGTQCGHMIIDINGPRCLTGPRGTGESLASVTALVQSVRDHLARGLPSSLGKKPPHEIVFIDIARAVRRKDPVITDIFDRWLDRFAAVVLNAYYAYTPDLIVLAGGPMHAAGVILPRLEATLNAAAFRVPPDHPIPIRAARFIDDAGWIGAALRGRDFAIESKTPA
ncbi:MAG: ROK family protein [Opitutaceae bacterium]|nr:ROK family protein [Opitutaceae bacterium]